MIVGAGDRVRFLREKEHMTQEELAEKLGVSGPMICQVERGAKVPGGALVAQIAEFFGCTTDFVLLGKQDTQA